MEKNCQTCYLKFIFKSIATLVGNRIKKLNITLFIYEIQDVQKFAMALYLFQY